MSATRWKEFSLFFLSKLADTVVVYFYTFIWLHADSLPFFSGFWTLLCNVSLSSPLHEDPGTHSQGDRRGDSNSAIELVPWSGHLLPVNKVNKAPKQDSSAGLWKCRRIVHNNTVHVRRHRVSKYTTLTKSCFVLRKQDMNHQQREKACHSFSLRLWCGQWRHKHATRPCVRSWSQVWLFF